MRGAISILTSILLVLVALSLLVLVYPWASSLASNFGAAVSTYTTTLENSLESFVEIYPPPGQVPFETNLIAVIHNSGLRPLSNAHVYIITKNGSIYYPTIIHIDKNGNTEMIAGGGPVSVSRGDTLVVFFPETNNVMGYTVVVSGDDIIAPYVVSIP